MQLISIYYLSFLVVTHIYVYQSYKRSQLSLNSSLLQICFSMSKFFCLSEGYILQTGSDFGFSKIYCSHIVLWLHCITYIEGSLSNKQELKTHSAPDKFVHFWLSVSVSLKLSHTGLVLLRICWFMKD